MKFIKEVFLTKWGIFFIFMIIPSLLMDLFFNDIQATTKTGEKVYIFTQGSAILGWVGLLCFLIIPSIVLRLIRKKPINSIIAVIWCVFFGFMWIGLKSFISDGSPARSGILFLASIILCWRFLTWAEDRFSLDGESNQKRNENA